MDNPRLEYLREKVKKLPLQPGIYIMKDKKGQIIYIGKAKALKNRVSSYFRSVAKHTPKVYRMVENVWDFESVSYTHLDVYKRQAVHFTGSVPLPHGPDQCSQVRPGTADAGYPPHRRTYG